jgi:Ca-activated chloride channel family protein
MFKFENVEHLYALVTVLIAVLAFLWYFNYRSKALEQLGTWGSLQKLIPGYSKSKPILKFVFMALALMLICVGWANPQWGSKKEKVQTKSVDVFIALDISNSMLAEDVRPSRLGQAQKFGEDLVKGLKGERIGLILFAGNAYLQMPLTTDYAAAAMFVKSANTGLAPTQGTAIADVIELAENSFSEDNKQHKALVIITDGENHDDKALVKAAAASDDGMLIFTVGVGSAEGAPIPFSFNGRTAFKQDENGQQVISKMNPDMLRELATNGNGTYFNLQENSAKVITELRKRIDKIEKRDIEQRSFTEYNSYFQYFIAIAVLLLLVDLFFSYRKNQWIKNADIFDV